MPDLKSARSRGSHGFFAEVLHELQARIRREHFDTWFRGFRLIEQADDRVEFAVPSVFARDWLRRHYQPLIEQAVTKAAKDPCAVVLSLDKAASRSRATKERGDARPIGALVGAAVDDRAASRRAAGIAEETAETSSAEASNAEAPNAEAPNAGTSNAEIPRARAGRHGADPAPASPAVGSPVSRSDGSVRGSLRADSEFGVLNTSYTFDAFVVGPCNRLSHAAALAIGDNPGRAYNPLFIHGNVGLGKTHLLQATACEVRKKQESARVLYLSCEDFTNGFIRAIRTGELDRFRDFHRGVDVLIIDDIQFLANKEKTQDEFFHTFNALYNDNRQIIISSDRSPLEIPTIEERLVSRFKWGLVTEMEVPCFDTRIAIVKRKAKMRQVDVADEVAEFIAERIDTNIRELEGAVIKVIGISSITEREISIELAEEALRGVAVPRNKKVTVADIMSLVTREFSISARELTGKGRTQAVSLPRQICMFLCRQSTDQSLEEIGRSFGNRDHTTVLYAVQKIKKRVKDDRMFRELIGSLNSRLV